MTENLIYIPFPRELYNDIVRFSDDKIDVAALAESQVLAWVEGSLEHFPSDDWDEERIVEVAGKYAPEILKQWGKEDKKLSYEKRLEKMPLVWKRVTIPAGTEVRMNYSGKQHYAKIAFGKVIDEDGKHSPAQWANKIANGTQRNAWRDLWFKLPQKEVWSSAEELWRQTTQ